MPNKTQYIMKQSEPIQRQTKKNPPLNAKKKLKETES